MVGITSRALFNLEKENEIFQKEGPAAYEKYQKDNENNIIGEGVYLQLVRKLLNLNNIAQEQLVEVILLSRNNADISVRIFNSINSYQLDVQRAVFCTGDNPYKYAADFGCSLFLSAEHKDVEGALANGIAAGLLKPHSLMQKPKDRPTLDSDILRFAFDGDAVLFSDEAEQVFQKEGQDAFTRSEQANVNRPLGKGPFHEFFTALQQLRERLDKHQKAHLIRTALITVRGMATYERVVRTMRKRGLKIDEALFLSGHEKGPFLYSYGADIFFDDKEENCESAADRDIPAGEVPRIGSA